MIIQKLESKFGFLMNKDPRAGNQGKKKDRKKGFFIKL